MPTSVFDGCGEGCGWSAAILAAIAWGTFGVPLKTKVNVEVNFFVMQSYKTMVCFLTSWLVIFLGEEVVFTPWGIVSGMFWVPGAACGIYAIRQAGLAISVGTWSSIQLCTSFLFGIVIFEEGVRSIVSAVLAFVFLMMGLIGMSVYADPSRQTQSSSSSSPTFFASPGSAPGSYFSSLSFMGYDKVSLTPDGVPNGTVATAPPTLQGSDEDSIKSASSTHGNRNRLRKTSKTGASNGTSSNGLHAVPVATPENGQIAPAPFSGGVNIPSGTTIVPMEMEMTAVSGELSDNSEASIPLLNGQPIPGEPHSEENKQSRTKGTVVLLGGRLILTKRQMGILGAVVNGAWGGLNLIPLHYAHRDQGITGAAYLISYGAGSMIVCICIWIGLFCYHLLNTCNKPKYQQDPQAPGQTPTPYMEIIKDAVDALPAWHVRKLGLPGLMAGTFYSIGNFCSILAVAYLGQAVGFSICQAQLLVSGLWGVFYFEEIKGREVVTKWFLSALLTVAGIIWLSYEHVGGEGGH